MCVWGGRSIGEPVIGMGVGVVVDSFVHVAWTDLDEPLAQVARAACCWLGCVWV